jgi:hypothetical protein
MGAITRPSPTSIKICFGYKKGPGRPSLWACQGGTDRRQDGGRGEDERQRRFSPIASWGTSSPRRIIPNCTFRRDTPDAGLQPVTKSTLSIHAPPPHPSGASEDVGGELFLSDAGQCVPTRMPTELAPPMRGPSPLLRSTKPIALLRELVKRAGQDVVITRGTTYDNRANLAAFSLRCRSMRPDSDANSRRRWRRSRPVRKSIDDACVCAPLAS